MTFISYAQNFEDVMLWRALKHVENGFYVDVGAQDPVIDSVSLAFYEHGWRGVHIEPTLHYADKLRQQRPDETVVQAAVGATAGTITFFEIADTGLSTGDAEIAKRHGEQGFAVRETTVPCLTLTQALEPYLHRQIHWMKIDTEGFERQIVQGWDGEKIRPWVVVVESTAPLTTNETYDNWEFMLFERGYELAYFDGLNRYYVSTDHRELLKKFDRPPNLFDDFALSGTQNAPFTNLLNARLATRDGELAQTQQQLGLSASQVAALTILRDAMLNSTSWRLTAPLRKFATAMRVVHRQPREFWPLVRRNLFRSQPMPGPVSPTASADRYASWIAQHEHVDNHASSTDASDSPVISVLSIATRSRASAVAATLQSLQEQSASGWQLVLGAFDLDESSRARLAELERKENGKVVLVRETGATLGAALRMAADTATGDFVMVLEPGDILPMHAIATIVERLRGDANIDILYGDEDVLDGNVRTAPQFKPEWSPEFLTAYNYFGRPTVLRRRLVSDIGSFAADLGPAAEWDLHLRATQAFDRVVSTPHVRRHTAVLCHRHPASGNGRPAPADPAAADFRKALVRHWQRDGLDAEVTTQADGTLHTVWNIADPPLVSVIIPSKNRADLLSVCLDGLWNKTAYPRIEIIVVDNGSTDVATLTLYEESRKKGVRVIPYNELFNYSRACNTGASAATGDLLLFLNNDIEIVSPDWLGELVRFARRPGVGVIGAKLIYPNGVLQHAGVLVGLDICGLVFTRAPEYEWGVFGSPSVTRNWMGVMGACQMVRRDAFQRIGGFDEGCAMATSDVRLCLDAWRAGYRTVYAPHAKLIHHEGMTRGHTNPEPDIRRTTAAIRALGIDEDPYYHPGLSGTTPIPTLRLGADPSAADSLKWDTDRRIGPTLDRMIPNLCDDSAMAVAAGRARDEILWAPDPPRALPDARSAARFMIDLLRRRPDIAKRFPNALSEGATGAFAAWLKDGALTRFGYPAEAAQSIDAAFRADLAAEARRVFPATADGTGRLPFLLQPIGRRDLAKTLFSAVARGELSKESSWWFLLETAEAGYRSDEGATASEDIKLTSPHEHPAGAMLALLIDRSTSIWSLRGNLVEIADELRALNGRILLLRRFDADKSVDSELASTVSELTKIVAVDPIDTGRDCGIVAACNSALACAREGGFGVFLLQAGAQPTAGSLSEMRNVADTDPMIGFVGAPTNFGAVTRAPLSNERLVGNALDARSAYEHIHPYLPRVSYVAAASGPCLYIKPSMLREFGELDPSYTTLAAAQDEFMMRCNLRGYRAALANSAYVHLSPDARDALADSPDVERDYQRLAVAYPDFHRSIRRTLESIEFTAKRLLAALAPDSYGRRRILFESSHLGCFFNGTFAVTTKLVKHFVEQFSSRYECWISCSAEALRFHGLDRVSRLQHAGDFAQARSKGPFLAAIRLAQPFSLLDLVQVGALAPLSGFLMLDTIAMDCQNLDEQDLREVWSHMTRTVSMIGYISQYSADQVNRRFAVPESVAQATILLSTDPADYVSEDKEPKRADHLLLIGNEYSHKHLRETIELFRGRPERPPLVVLGLKVPDEAGITSYTSGSLDDAFVEELYRNAIALVFPSHYEGFGLPLMHALGYKKPVFARAIPAFEEIRSRAPGGSNIHLFASTEEIVEAALTHLSWHGDGDETVGVQTWASAAQQIESLVGQAESKLSYQTLHDRLLAVSGCEALIRLRTTPSGPVSMAAEVGAASADSGPLPVQASAAVRVQQRLARSCVVRGARAWLQFKPGSRPHRLAHRMIRSIAQFVLSRPTLASAARALLVRHPKLAARVRNAVRGPNAERYASPAFQAGDGSRPAPFPSSRAVESYYVSPESQRIAQDLQRLISRQ